MERLFKIRCSQIGKIMGRVGLTDKQLEEMETLSKKNKRTKIQEYKLRDLLRRYNNHELPETCKTYLHTWYANDKEQIHSKYMDKGIEVENDLINFMADVLGYGMADKNTIRLHDDWIEGECDVNLPDCVVDVKASWNRTTLHKQVLEGLDKDYEWQLKGYCYLYKKSKGILFFGLMNTPETDYSNEVIFEDLPTNERWIAYEVIPIEQDFEAIKDRVIKCREYLADYDKLIKSKMGKIN